MSEKNGIRSKDNRVLFSYKGDVTKCDPATFSDQDTIGSALVLTVLSTKRVASDK